MPASEEEPADGSVLRGMSKRAGRDTTDWRTSRPMGRFCVA